MKQLILSFLLLLASGSARAIRVTGVVTDRETNGGLAGVTIQLMDRDSTLLAQDATGERGRFSIEAKSGGDYILRFSFVGFLTAHVEVRNARVDTDLGTVALLPAPRALDEVVVEASGYTRVDRQVIFPPRTILECSFSGLEVLRGLALPGVLVDVNDNRVSSTDNRPVQLRINDIPVTMDEVTALDPKRVQRVEYIDMPGVRYGDAGTVINFRLKPVEHGLAVGGNAQVALTAPFTNDQLFVRYNNRRSEFGLNYRVAYSDYDDSYSEKRLSLLLPEGSRTLTRQGERAPLKNHSHDISLSYNWRNDAGTLLNAVFRNKIGLPERTIRQRVTDEMNEQTYSSLLHTRDRSYTPSLDLYLQQEIGDRQTLLANLVGTYFSTDYDRGYREWDADPRAPTADYSYHTDGKKGSVMAEAIYENRVARTLTLSAGLRYSHSYTENAYAGTMENVTNTMRSSDIYGYAQAQGRAGKFGYQVGVGFSRQYFNEEDARFDRWLFRPRVSLSYTPRDHATLRYSFYMLPFLPSLSQLSDFRQWQNPYEVYSGNPGLVPSESYANILSFNYRKGILTVSPRLYWQYNHRSVQHTIYLREEGCRHYIEYHPENQRGRHHIQGYLHAAAELLRGHLTLSGYAVLNRYLNYGNNYTRHLTNLYGGLQLDGYYGAWSLSASYTFKSKWQVGETLQLSPARASVSLRYRYKSMQYGLIVQNPFLPDGTPERTVTDSPYTSKRTAAFVRDEGNQVRLSVAWNFDLGRKYERARKRLNNTDNDTGVVK